MLQPFLSVLDVSRSFAGRSGTNAGWCWLLVGFGGAPRAPPVTAGRWGAPLPAGRCRLGGGHPEAMDDFVSVVAGTLSPVEFFDPENLARLMGLAPAM